MPFVLPQKKAGLANRVKVLARRRRNRQLRLTRRERWAAILLAVVVLLSLAFGGWVAFQYRGFTIFWDGR